MFKDQRLSWTAGAHLEAVKLAFMAGLAEAQSFREKALAFGHLSHREDRSIKAAHGLTGADLFRCPALPVVIRVFEDFERQSSRVLESDVLLTEALLNAGVLNLVLIEMVFPERQRAFGRRIRSGRDLARALTSSLLAVGERSHHRAWLGVRIGVVQMVDRNGAVHQNGLLDHPQTDYLREKIDVLLGSACTRGDVVDACYVILHRSSPVVLNYTQKHDRCPGESR